MDTETKIQELREAREELDRVEGYDLERTSELYGRLKKYIDRYREEAVGRGNFESYLEFQSLVAEVEEEIENDGEGVYRVEDFEKAIETFEKRKLDEGDFDRGERTLSDIRGVVKNREKVERLEKELETRVDKLRKKKKELEFEVRKKEKKLGLIRDAPNTDPSELTQVIERYNDSVEEDFKRYRENTDAVEFIEFCEKTASKTLISTPELNAHKSSKIEEAGLHDSDIDTVLEYLGYSNSKLSHYLDGVTNREFQNAVPEEFLKKLDSTVFKIDPELQDHPGELDQRIDEITSCIDSFADTETVRRLRKIKKQVATGGYKRKKQAMEARGNVDNNPQDIENKIEENEREIDRIEDEVAEIQKALDKS